MEGLDSQVSSAERDHIDPDFRVMKAIDVAMCENCGTHTDREPCSICGNLMCERCVCDCEKEQIKDDHETATTFRRYLAMLNGAQARGYIHRYDLSISHASYRGLPSPHISLYVWVTEDGMPVRVGKYDDKLHEVMFAFQKEYSHAGSNTDRVVSGVSPSPAVHVADKEATADQEPERFDGLS